MTGPELQLNKAWLQHYIAGDDADQSNRAWFDDVVVSTERIGCGGSAVGTRSHVWPIGLSMMSHRTSRSSVSFLVTVEKQTDFGIDIYNTAGQKLWNIESRDAESGLHHIAWDRSAESIAEGLYVVVLKSRDGRAYLTLAVVK